MKRTQLKRPFIDKSISKDLKGPWEPYIYIYIWMCVCKHAQDMIMSAYIVCAQVSVYMCVCVHMCVCVCMHACLCIHDLISW